MKKSPHQLSDKKNKTKTLLLIRHAKSDWGNFLLADFDRPLNERGKKDAPEMAARIAEQISIDALIASPAKRAKKTAIAFAKAYKKNTDEIIFIEELYGATPKIFNTVISNISDDYDTIAIFSHNPGITEMANMITDTQIDNMPTCAVFAVTSDCMQWKDFENATKRLLFFEYPKKYNNSSSE